jgi:F-box domain
MISATPIGFEDLPNELLVMIFRYLKPNDRLNMRGFNSRLRNMPENAKVSDTVRYAYREDQWLHSFRAQHIIYLALHDNDLLKVDLNHCQLLRSLTVDCAVAHEHIQRQVSSTTPSKSHRSDDKQFDRRVKSSFFHRRFAGSNSHNSSDSRSRI